MNKDEKIGPFVYTDSTRVNASTGAGVVLRDQKNLNGKYINAAQLLQSQPTKEISDVCIEITDGATQSFALGYYTYNNIIVFPDPVYVDFDPIIQISYVPPAGASFLALRWSIFYDDKSLKRLISV